jgi:hypothetical protein
MGRNNEYTSSDYKEAEKLAQELVDACIPDTMVWSKEKGFEESPEKARNCATRILEGTIKELQRIQLVLNADPGNVISDRIDILRLTMKAVKYTSHE